MHQITNDNFINRKYSPQKEDQHRLIMSARQLTISLQGLNTLYCKYLSDCISQYLPRDLITQVNTLINMRSAIQVYKYLDGKLSCLQNSESSNGNMERKPRESKTIGEVVNNNNPASSIDRRAYLDDDKEKIENRRMNSLLKRANTLFQKPEDRQKALSSATVIVEHKQQQKTHTQSQSTSYIPTQPYRQQPESDNRLYQSPDYKKQLTSRNNTVNRNKLLALAKQARQIFSDNAKKILRYENLSSDLAAMQTSNKLSDGVGNGYANGGSYAYNFMGKRY